MLEAARQCWCLRHCLRWGHSWSLSLADSDCRPVFGVSARLRCAVAVPSHWLLSSCDQCCYLTAAVSVAGVGHVVVSVGFCAALLLLGAGWLWSEGCMLCCVVLLLLLCLSKPRTVQDAVSGCQTGGMGSPGSGSFENYCSSGYFHSG
jgi:hypothetical protein